jgi:hypothetical protein
MLLRIAPGPTIHLVCRVLGLFLPPVFQEKPPVPPSA